MNRFSAGEIAEAVSGKIDQGNPDVRFDNVSTDTRKIHKGDLFVALVGEKFDAHDFVETAIANGAGGIIVSRRIPVKDWQGPVILVKNTLKALQQLASFNRENFNGIVIGVTGSNGKTTTKDMIASVLKTKYTTLKTEANFNNDIGLPQTLLKLDNSYGAVVLEMGMRGIGEIDLLASIARPDGAVITNVGETHLERLGTVENIAKAKGEILDHISSIGFAVLNGDDERVRNEAKRSLGRTIFYGTQNNADIRAYNIIPQGGKSIKFDVLTKHGEMTVNLSVAGKHNVLNALAAVGVGLEGGLTLEEIRDGLENLDMTSMRQEIIEGGKYTVINDTYNANPVSVKAALSVLADLGAGKRKVAILGDMYELGQRSLEGHREVGIEAAKLGIDIVVSVGQLAGEIAIGASMEENPPEDTICFKNNGQLKERLEQIIRAGDVILVKGSRGMKMEEITKRILDLDH